MNTKTVKFKDWKCELFNASYEHPDKTINTLNPIALWLEGAEGEDYQGDNIATCTVNLIDKPIPKRGWVYIKEYSENKGMTNALIRSGIIHEENIIPMTTGGFGSVVNLCKLKINLK